MMRKAAFLVTVIVVVLAQGAFGADRIAARDREMAQFAKEVAAKIVYRSGADIAVSARDCRMHIEFGSFKAAFDLPLAETTLAATDAEDGIIVNNRAMTRTFSGRAPEAFQNLILRFHRSDLKPMLATFERAISACSEAGQSVVAVR
jgi:hypothetical protein